MASEVLSKERKTIVIKSAGTPMGFGNGDGQKVSFAGEDNISYTCFAKDLFENIKTGATLDADTEQRKNGEHINWVVTQIYVNGSPVGKKGGFAKKGGYGKSPEEIRSIENQVRVKIISELWIHSTITPEDPLVGLLRKYLLKLGDAPPPPPQQARLTEPVKTDAKVSAATLKTLGGVAKANDYNSDLMSSIIMTKFKTEKAKDITEAQAQELIAGLNAGKWKPEEPK